MVARDDNESAAAEEAFGGFDGGYNRIGLIGERIGQIVCGVVDHQGELGDSGRASKKVRSCDTDYLMTGPVVAVQVELDKQNSS